MNPVIWLTCRTLAIGVAVCLIFASTAVGRDPSLSAAPPQSPALAEVRWNDDSFWGARQRACREGTLPTLTRIMLGKERSHFVENFRIAAGMAAGSHRGPAWNDGDTYKWLEAMSATLAWGNDPQLRHVIDESIAVIRRAQRADGYLHTPVLISSRKGENLARPLSEPIHFEMYNFGHLMTAACVHFEVTRERSLLEVAIKAADCLDREFSQPDTQLARHAICPAHYMGILDLYRVTGELRYLPLAEQLLAMRDLVQGGDDNQDRIPLREQREAVGHAVRANYLYAGAADLVLETGDQALKAALESCWLSVQQRKIYITGGCGALFDGASPDGSAKQSQITRVHQAYGRSFQLPNSTAHNETCAAIGNVLWNHRMWQLSGEARFIDALETSLYNAVLAGVSLDGQRFFYTNTLRQLDEMPTELRWPRRRQEWISCYCCPPNVARIIASVNRYAYAADDNSATLLLYGSNRIDTLLKDGSRLTMTQVSDYPVDGRVRLEFQAAPPRDFSLRLRVPGWCPNARLSVNGVDHTENLSPASFVKLTRRWSVGDRVELHLDMPVRLMTAHRLVEECLGHVAVTRGPLVYCVESTDLPSDLPAKWSLNDVVVSAKSQWKLAAGQNELPTVPVLHGELAIESGTVQTASKLTDASLYSPYQPLIAQSFSARLVPYFAWGNRGPSEMSVWIPVRP